MISLPLSSFSADFLIASGTHSFGSVADFKFLSQDATRWAIIVQSIGASGNGPVSISNSAMNDTFHGLLLQPTANPIAIVWSSFPTLPGQEWHAYPNAIACIIQWWAISYRPTGLSAAPEQPINDRFGITPVTTSLDLGGSI